MAQLQSYVCYIILRYVCYRQIWVVVNAAHLHLNQNKHTKDLSEYL